MIDNNRYCTLQFPVEVNTVLHGFAGYFETVLYQDITLSESGTTYEGITALVTFVQSTGSWGLLHKAFSPTPSWNFLAEDEH